MEIEKTPLMLTLVSAELAEIVTREMQLTLKQVASILVPILVIPSPSLSARQRESITGLSEQFEAIFSSVSLTVDSPLRVRVPSPFIYCNFAILPAGT